MADVVHEHTTDSSGQGIGFFMGMILLVIVVLALIYWGLPLLRGGTGTNVNVPGKIDVNVNQPK